MSASNLPPSSHRIAGAVARWQAEYNRRRAAEAGLWLVASLVAGGALVAAAAFVFGASFPTTVLATLVGGALVTVAALRWRARCIGLTETAILMDRSHDTKDLLSTALAVESHTVECADDLAQVVSSRAAERVGSLSLGTIGRVTYPRRSLAVATLCVAAACAAYLFVDNDTDPIDGASATAGAEGENPDGSALGGGDDPENQALPDEELAALRENLERLAALQERLGADQALRERLESIREQIDRVAQGDAQGQEAVGALSRAERELAQLARQAQENELMDPEALAAADPEALAESLRSSIEQGDAQTAASLSAAMTQQAANADSEQLREMGEAVAATERVASEDAADGGRMSPEDRQAADQQLDSAGAALSEANRGESVSELTELTEMLTEAAGEGSPTEQDITDALSELRSVRERTLASINGEPRPGRTGDPREPGRDRGDRESVAQRPDRPSRPGRTGDCDNPGAGGEGEPGMCNGPGQEGRGEGRGEGEGEGEGNGDNSNTIAVRGSGSGGTSPGPGQGPTPTPWEGELPELNMPSAEWIESQWDGSPDGVIQMIESASHGERSMLEYRQLLHTYLDVAEASASREDIPLTRRNYIQDYFEAIRQ